MAEDPILEAKRKEPLTILLTACGDCVWYTGQQTCKAFPEKIPGGIYHNGEPHDEWVKGQTGFFTHMTMEDALKLKRSRESEE